MKILIVAEPGLDGVFRHVEDLIEFLHAQDHLVHFAYSDVRGSDRLGTLVARVQAKGGRTLNLRVTGRPDCGDPVALWRLRRLHDETTPDLVHAHSSKAGALVRLLRISFGVQTPLVYTPHAYFGMDQRKSVATWCFNLLERVLGRQAFTINVSHDEAQFAERTLRVPAARRALVPSGVDTDRFSPIARAERHRLRLESGIPADAIVLGALGRFSYQKDPWTLYRAFDLCASQFPRLCLVHLGLGDMRPAIRRHVLSNGHSDRVIWIDYMRDPARFHALLDGFILTSRYEGLSLAALEALALDVPLILSDAPGNREFRRFDLSHVWWGRVQSPESFSTAIAAWYDDLARNRPSNHRAKAIALFSRQIVFNHIAEIYRATIAVSGPLATPSTVSG